MGLRSGISASNRVVEQGKQYTYNSVGVIFEPAYIWDYSKSGGTISKTFAETTKVTQFRTTINVSMRYKYVGLTSAAATSAASTIRQSYIASVPVFALGYAITGSGAQTVVKEKYMQAGYAPVSGARVVPVYRGGQTWDVEVDVNATIDWYFDENESRTDSVITGIIDTYFPCDFSEVQ